MIRTHWLKKLTLLAGCFIASCNQVPPPITTPVLLSPHQMMVQPGDTLYGIASRYGVSLKQLMTVNHLRSSHIQPGQILSIPQKEAIPEMRESSSSEGAIEKADLPPLVGGPENVGIPSYEPLTSRIMPGDLDPQIAQEIAQEAKPEALSSVSESSPAGGTSFVSSVTPTVAGLTWPIRGDVVSQFSRKAGKRLDGIEIAGKLGAPVKASTAGTVLICKKDFDALGNVLIVKSADGSLTAYGHLQSFKVAKGQAVQRGDVLGTVGTSGNIKKPQLYFEVRKVAKAGGSPQPVDPVPLLKGS